MALKQIRKDQVRAGMWIDRIKGFWFFHPFWETGFVITHRQDVAALRKTWIGGVIIDTAKGLDVDGTEPARSVASNPVRETPHGERRLHLQSRISRRRGPRKPRPLPKSCSTAAELGRASRIVKKARGMMRELLADVRLGKAVNSDKFLPLVDEIAGSLSRNRSTMTSVLRLKHKDEYTYMHSVSVAALMINLARELQFSEWKVREAGMAGLLHDIGKMAIAETILSKPGSLTDDELAAVRSHPQRGYALLQKDNEISIAAMDVALHHHEKVDGTGYPHNLGGEDISQLARMGAICDVYDAVTSDRPYKAPWIPAVAIREMLEWEGHFDKDILDAFIRSVGIYPVGSLVSLNSGRLALVIEAERDDPMRPGVRAFAQTGTRAALPIEDIPPGSEMDLIVRAEDPQDHGFAEWESFWPKLARAARNKPFAKLEQALIPWTDEGAAQAAA